MLTKTRTFTSIALVFALAGSAAAQDRADSSLSTSPGVGPSPFSEASIARAVANQPTTVADWQRQYDDALRRRDAGSRKAKLGLIVLGGGLVLSIAGLAQAADYDGNSGSGLTMMGLLADLVGSGVIYWGIGQRNGAREDMETLERLRTSVKNPAAQGAQVSNRKRPVFSYRVSW